MDGATLARRSLRADSLYCAAAGLAAAGLAESLGEPLGVDPRIVRAAGFGTLCWAGLVGVVSLRQDWRLPTRWVAIANAIAAAGLVAWGSRHESRAIGLLLGLAGAEVGAFAASQYAALSRRTRA